MIRLYWDRGCANMAPHAILEELGCEYELLRVDLEAGMHREPAYLAINPNGLVPALADGEATMYEAAAIVMYLVDRHPGAGLAPAPSEPRRGIYYQWMSWLTNTLQETGCACTHPQRWARGPQAEDAVRHRAGQRLADQWRIVEDALADRPWLLGDQPSAADFYLFMVAYWSRDYPERAEDRPRLRAHMQRTAERPAVRRMLDQEGLSRPILE